MSMSKRERKQARKELVRAKERRAALLSRCTLSCALLSLAGLAVAATLAAMEHRFPATWVAGGTGIVILVAVGFASTRAFDLRHHKRRMSFLGWTGLVCASLAGIQLVAALVLLLAGHGEASELTGVLSFVPLLAAFGFLTAEWTKDVPGSGNQTDTMSYLSNLN